MKLTSIDLYSNNKQVATLSFRDPTSSNPYVAQSTTGLDADEIIPKYYGRSGKTGAGLYNLSLIKRDVVILIALNPQFSRGKTYSDLRDDLYKAVASSRNGLLEIRFMSGTKPVASVQGFVTKMETNLFSKTPQVQMTISCDEGLISSFEKYEADVIHIGVDTTITDENSTAPHGFDFRLTFDDPSESFVIQPDDSVDPEWKFEVVYDFLADDELYFSSITTDKQLYVVRGLTTTHLVDKITIGSLWPIIFPGDNDFQFIADGAFTWNSFEYYETYWGV